MSALPILTPFGTSPHHNIPAMVLRYAPFVRGLLVVPVAHPSTGVVPVASGCLLWAIERSE